MEENVKQSQKLTSEVQKPMKSESATEQLEQKKSESSPTENLSKELINHLSKEIETITNNNNMFRARTSFIVFVGPFIMLGSFLIALRGDQRSTNLPFQQDTWTAIGVALILAGYITVAYISARVEKHGWDTCNHYRRIIERLYKNPKSLIEENELVRGYKIIQAYLFAYTFMALAFLGVLFAVLNKIL